MLLLRKTGSKYDDEIRKVCRHRVFWFGQSDTGGPIFFAKERPLSISGLLEDVDDDTSISFPQGSSQASLYSFSFGNSISGSILRT